MIQVSDGVVTVTCRGWPPFERLLHRNRKNLTNFVWRGQQHAGWSLLPSVDRATRSLSVADTAKVQAALLRRFRLAARGRLEGIKEPENDDEWWALGRHFGLLTPLLDWTLSPYIASFFSFQDPIGRQRAPRAIYGLSALMVHKKGKSLPVEERIRFISPIKGDNPRLVHQRGVFTQGPSGVDIESWVKSRFAGEGKFWILLKVEIPNSARASFLLSLERMAISPLELFPDLTGASAYSNLGLEVGQYTHALFERSEFDLENRA